MVDSGSLNVQLLCIVVDGGSRRERCGVSEVS